MEAVDRRKPPRRPRGTLKADDPTRVATASVSRDHKRPKGASGTVINLGLITKFELTSEIRGKAWYEAAQEMMQDPHVKRSVEAIVDPLLAAHWDIAPGDKSPEAIEAADYCRWNLFEHLSWERTLRLGVTGMVRDGVRMFEPTDSSGVRIPAARFPLHPGGGLGVAFTKFHDRPAHTVDHWIQSKKDPERAAGFVQMIQGSDAEAPGERTVNIEAGDLMLRMVWDQEGANFEGLPPLRAAYGAFKAKRILMTLSMMRHEREGLGIPEIKEPEGGYEPTPDEEEVAKRILRDLRGHEHAYIYLPSGWAFNWKTSGGQSTGLQEAIEQCNRDIAYNLGVAWMLLGIAGKTGSWALATEQRGHYVLSLEKYARAVEAAFNLGVDGWSPIERLVRRNYGPDVALPRLIARNMPTRDWTRLLPMLPALVKAKLLKSDAVLRGFLRQVTYLPEEDEATAEEYAEEARSLLEQDEVDDEVEDLGQAVADHRFVQQLASRVDQLEHAMHLASRLTKEGAPA